MVLWHAYGRDVAGNPKGLPVMVVLTRSATLVTVPARPFHRRARLRASHRSETWVIEASILSQAQSGSSIG